MFLLYIYGSAGAICERPVRLQLLQVQDSSNSFSDDISYMSKFMGELTNELANEYGILEYGLSTFTDKPQIITGSGTNSGVWKHYGDLNYKTDHCYSRVQAMGTQVTDMDSIILGGGKDDDENVYDALAMGVIDPSMKWITSDVDDDGNAVVKIAVVITDAAGHRNSSIDTDISRRNWYFEELMAGPCSYNDLDCEVAHGEFATKSGYNMSLTGVLSHYNHFKVKSDVEMLTAREYWGWDKYEEFTEYRYCCTGNYGKFPYVYYRKCRNFDTYNKCSKVSCKYCEKDKCDEYCPDKNFEVDWFKDIQDGDVDIIPYKYGDDRLSVDNDLCAEMEYPDPMSEEYANMFKKYNISPIFFLRLPGTRPELGGNDWPFQIRDLYMSNNMCPIVGQRLARYWLCYADPSRRKDDGITYTGVCEDYTPLELSLNSFYEDCYREHYEPVVSKLKEYGVSASYTIVDSYIKEQKLLDKLKDVISAAMIKFPSCKNEDTATLLSTRSIESTFFVSTSLNMSTTDIESPTDFESTTDNVSSAGVIAGAAAGVMASIGVIGAGTKILLSSSSVSDTHPDVEIGPIDNNVLEREQITVIDADMYN